MATATRCVATGRSWTPRTSIRSEDHLTAVVGVDKVVVVTTQAAMLVVGQEHGDKVKQLVEKLRHEDRREAWSTSVRTGRGATINRSMVGRAIKRIVVKPGGALSLQKHFHRAEHWVVVAGIVEVTRGNEIVLVHENRLIYLPMASFIA